jgi:cytosine/uracil/thiamine/allantoin permease
MILNTAYQLIFQLHLLNSMNAVSSMHLQEAHVLLHARFMIFWIGPTLFYQHQLTVLHQLVRLLQCVALLLHGGMLLLATGNAHRHNHKDTASGMSHLELTQLLLLTHAIQRANQLLAMIIQCAPGRICPTMDHHNSSPKSSAIQLRLPELK